MSGDPKQEHRWGEPDEYGVRACAKRGCTVRVTDSFRAWQRAKGGHWRPQHRELIPPCAPRKRKVAPPPSGG